MAPKPKQLRADISESILAQVKCTVYLGAVVKGEKCTIIVIPDMDNKTYRMPNAEAD